MTKERLTFTEIITPLAGQMLRAQAVTAAAGGAIGYLFGLPLTGAIYGATAAGSHHLGVAAGASLSTGNDRQNMNAIIKVLKSSSALVAFETSSLAALAAAYTFPEWRTTATLAACFMKAASTFSTGVIEGYEALPVKTTASLSETAPPIAAASTSGNTEVQHPPRSSVIGNSASQSSRLHRASSVSIPSC